MNQVEFQTGIQALSQCFGERNYPAERVRRIWEACGNYPDGIFTEAIGRCIDRMRVAPFREDLADACRAVADQWRSSGKLGGRVIEHRTNFSHPWPTPVVAIMHMIRDGNTERGFKFGLQSSGLTEETAWQLYEDFACGNWHTERSRKIIAALKPARWVIGKTQQNGPQVPVQNAPISNDVCLSKAIDDLFGVGQRDEG